MAVFRVNKTSDFTVMSNVHLRDKGLSLKAKGLLSLILSLPDDWKYSIAGLAAISKEGESAIKTALDELTSAGYVVVGKVFPGESASGRIEYVYNIYETPKPQVKQGGDFLPLEILGLENRPQLNTEEQSTDYREEDIEEERPDFEEIVSYLNDKAGTSYRSKSESTRKLIRARMAEGFTVEDFKRVIDNKVLAWSRDPKMRKYIRPATLFCASKFEGYLNERPKGVANATTDPIYDKLF